MLSRKSLGVAGAALFGSVALLGANSANAKIVVGGTTAQLAAHADVKFAVEALVDSDTTATTPTGSDVKYYHVSNNNSKLDIEAQQTLQSSSSLPIYIRYELENMVFGAPYAGFAGGARGDNYVVVQWNTDGAVGTQRTITPTVFGVLPGKAGSVTATIHLSASDSLSGANPVGSAQTRKDAVMVVDGIMEKGTSRKSVADVDEGYKKFVQGETGTGAATTVLGSIGSLEIGDVPDVNKRDGSDLGNVNEILSNTSPISVVFKGDFSGHTGDASTGHSFTLNDAATCGGNNVGGTLTINAAKTELTPGDQPTGDDTWHLCLGVPASNDKPIPDTPFTATVTYSGVTGAVAPRAPMTVTVGSIERSGASYRIPYLTTHSSYNQRVVIMNRGAAATYSFGGFQVESGMTATVGSMASGTLPSGLTVVRSTNIVSGVTRAAATLSIAASPGNISAAVQQVNLKNGSVDTVYLD